MKMDVDKRYLNKSYATNAGELTDVSLEMRNDCGKMREANKLARKLLTKALAKRVESLSDENAETILPKLKSIELFIDGKLNDGDFKSHNIET